VAESAHDAARTGWLVGNEVLSGKAFPTFASTAFDDATKALAGASDQFASEAPPNAASRQLRDQLSPLLTTEVTVLADASAATDDATLRTAVQRLDQLANKLDDFIEAHR
jgi:phage gp29-like protein